MPTQGNDDHACCENLQLGALYRTYSCQVFFSPPSCELWTLEAFNQPRDDRRHFCPARFLHSSFNETTQSAHTFLSYQYLHTYPLSESPIQRESTPMTTSQETIDPISVPEANWHVQVNETRQQRFYFLHITSTYTPIYSASPQSNGKVPYLFIYSPPPSFPQKFRELAHLQF